MNFVGKAKGFLIKPSKTFDASKDYTLIEAMKYYIIIAAIHSFISALLSAFVFPGHGYVLPPSYILLPLYVTIFGSIFGGYVGFTMNPGIEGAIFVFITLMIFRNLRVFIGGAILHVCLKIVGRKKKRNYSDNKSSHVWINSCILISPYTYYNVFCSYVVFGS